MRVNAVIAINTKSSDVHVAQSNTDDHFRQHRAAKPLGPSAMNQQGVISYLPIFPHLFLSSNSSPGRTSASSPPEERNSSSKHRG